MLLVTYYKLCRKLFIYGCLLILNRGVFDLADQSALKSVHKNSIKLLFPL